MRTDSKTATIDILVEHPDEEELTEELLRLADQLEDDGEPAGSTLERLLAAVEERDSGLMGHQESHAFPSIEARFGAASPVLTVLERDHAEIRRLTEAVRRRAVGGDDAGALATDVRSLARLRAEHVLREGAILRTLRHHVAAADARWEPSRTWAVVAAQRIRL